MGAMTQERARPNDPRAWIYWDVEVVDDSGDEDILVDEQERVTVTMDSEALSVVLRDINETPVARFSGQRDEDDEPLTHAVFFPAAVEIVACRTADGRGVNLSLRPHLESPPPNT
jgi:hypothetical protein